MKKFSVFFAVLLLAVLLAGSIVAVASETDAQMLSGYYGINQAAGLIGQIPAGTDADTLLSRVLGKGEFSLTDGVKTGSALTMTVDGQEVDRLTLVIHGDCNTDGSFDVADALLLKALILEKQSLNNVQKQAADINGDTSVDIADYMLMKRSILGLADFSPYAIAGAQAHNSVILAAGETYAFAATGEDPVTVEGDAVTWEGGVATAVKLGTARLTSGESSLIITVCQEGLKVSLPDSTLFVGPTATSQLMPVLNHPVTGADITYSVSDESIVKVDENGLITGIASGTAKVTATLGNGASDTQDVVVITLIDNVTLGETSIKLKPNTSKTIPYTISPASSMEKLVWTSSDNNIATVDENGVVTGKALGTVTITATTQYGKVAATCKVKVCNLIQVALTFDDGPSSTYTLKLLDLLKKYDVQASFFLVGKRISTCPTAVQRMTAEGHEIGHHTWDHTYFSQMTTAQIKADFNKVQQAIWDAGGGNITLFRAPGGGITDRALNAISLPHIYWSVDTRDWETRNATSVKNAIINGLKDGKIILLHDIHGTTYEGTKAALEYIFSKDMDVEFLTVTELLSRNGTAPTAGKTYYSAP